MKDAQDLPKQPLAEVFGYPIDNFSFDAERHRRLKLCPFNNKVPNCTKSRAKNPIGVCSVYDATQTATVTCPIRFREDWYIAEHAASFFFPEGTNFTSLTEVRLSDKYGKTAGNIDIVLVSYDDTGRLTDFGSKDEAELVWLVYDLKHDQATNLRRLTLTQTVYTRFISALDRITRSEPGNVQDFIDLLQAKLDETLTMGAGIGTTPDAISLQDIEETTE